MVAVIVQSRLYWNRIWVEYIQQCHYISDKCLNSPSTSELSSLVCSGLFWEEKCSELPPEKQKHSCATPHLPNSLSFCTEWLCKKPDLHPSHCLLLFHFSGGHGVAAMSNISHLESQKTSNTNSIVDKYDKKQRCNDNVQRSNLNFSKCHYVILEMKLLFF